MSIIEVKDLTFGYDADTQVLHGITFTVDEPSFICIVGPNGVGKSTLIRCVNNLITPTGGSVKVYDKDVTEYTLKEMAKVVGYVPVATSDFNVMTVLDTVLLGRYAHQKWKTDSDDINLAYKALEAMEIEWLAMRDFNELSAGQHQKVALARGLVQEPMILILDEPTSNLDIRHQMYVLEFLKKLSKKARTTVIMVSHDLNLSAKFADKIMVMAPPGILYSFGTPQETITEEMIRDVYKVDCSIVDDMGSPHVILQSVLFDQDGDSERARFGSLIGWLIGLSGLRHRLYAVLAGGSDGFQLVPCRNGIAPARPLTLTSGRKWGC